MDFLGELKGHKDEVTCVAVAALSGSGSDFTASSNSAAHAGRYLATGSLDGTVRLWRVSADEGERAASAKCVKCLSFGKEVVSVAFSPDWGNDSATVMMHVAIDGGEIRGISLLAALEKPSIVVQMGDDCDAFRVPSGEEVNEMAILPGERIVATTDDEGDVCIAEWKNGNEASRTRLSGSKTHSNICTSAFFVPESSKDGARLVTGGMDSRIMYWDIAWSDSGSVIVADVESVDIKPFVDTSAASSSSGTQLLNPPLVHTASCDPSGETFSAGLGDGTIASYSCADLTCENRFTAHRAAVASVAHDRASNLLLSASSDMTIKSWRGSVLKHEAALPHKPNWIACCAGTVFVADVTSSVKMFRLFKAS